MDSFGHPFKSGKYPNPHVDGAAHTAAFHGDLEALKELLQTYGKDSASFAAHGPAGWNPLMVAAYAGQLEVVRFLLDQGFNLEERDICLRTPIHAAVKAGHINVVRLLVERGCDVDRMDDGQRTPLIYAAAAHNVAVMSCLLDAGADPDATDQSLRSPLHYLTEGGRGRHAGGRGRGEGRAGEEAAAEAGVRLLLLHGAHPGLPDAEGHTPLHLAAASSQAHLVSLLLGLGGADPTLRCHEGETPLALAKTLEVEKMLKAGPVHAYVLKRLRCCASMSMSQQQEQPPPTEDGGADGGKEEKGEGQEEEEEEEEEEEGEAARAATASARRVQHAILTYREAMDPPAPLPRIEFRFSSHQPQFQQKEEEEQERAEQEAWAAMGAQEKAGLVLEEVVLHMKGDLFLELVQQYLWPWHTETAAGEPGSLAWG